MIPQENIFKMSETVFSRRRFSVVTALLLVVLVLLAYTPAICVMIYKSGYIEKGRVGNVVVEFGENWVPLLSNNSWPGKILGVDRPKLLFVRSSGILPGWSNSIVVMKFNNEEIAALNIPMGNLFSEDVLLPWGTVKIYREKFGGYAPDFGVQFSTKKGREQDFMDAIREIKRVTLL